MEKMKRGLALQNWVLIVQSKYFKCPRIYLLNLSAQARKFWISVVRALACAFDLYSIHSLYNIQTGEKYADTTSINHSPVFPPLVSNLDCHRIEVVEKHALKHELLTTKRKKKRGNIYTSWYE